MSVDSSRDRRKDLVVGTIAARGVHGSHPRRVRTCWAPPQGRFQRISEPEIRARHISRAEKFSESFGQLRGFRFMGMFHAGCLVQRFSEFLREVRTREFGAP
eukprot:2070742-Pyramimonas_sp.AAC.1